jgi:hypothetical protein
MKILIRVIAVLVLLIAANVYAGGWATVTIRSLPEFVVTGTALEFRFIVRQHGVTPLDGVNPGIEAVSANHRTIKGNVSPVAGKSGEYTARLTFPEAGNWAIRMDSGWVSSAALLPITAIRAGTQAPPSLTPAARGERLFASKACITCHVNKEIAVANLASFGPELTGRTFPEEYLRKVLADPASAGLEMPNQELAGGEIESLVAYINRQR